VKRILITGGSGTIGASFIERYQEKYEFFSYSRNEKMQVSLKRQFPDIQIILGSVEDYLTLHTTISKIKPDVIIHAAALKHIDSAEISPIQAVKSNIIGSLNVINSAVTESVPMTVAISTDKACNPVNLYGATKLASDKLFIAGSLSHNNSNTNFSVVRYGNVMGSRGSVIPFFLNKRKEGQLPITDVRMTRFMISLEQGVNLVWHAFENMLGGEIYVKKIPSIKVTDIAKVIAPEAKIKVIGIRPGEKLHEQMINYEDAPHTYEYEDYFKILPAINSLSKDKKRIGNGMKVVEGFTYTSDNNDEWMDNKTLLSWLESNINKIGAI